MRIGEEITAMHSGTAVLVSEQFSDSDRDRGTSTRTPPARSPSTAGAAAG